MTQMNFPIWESWSIGRPRFSIPKTCPEVSPRLSVLITCPFIVAPEGPSSPGRRRMAERRLNVAKRRETGLPPGARWRGKSIQVLVYRGYDAATGKREYASGTAKTVEEAWRLWRKLKTQVEEQEYIPPSRQTLAQYLAEWLEKSAKPNVKPKTYERYEALVRVHIVPRLGTVRLSKLTPRHIEEMLADLKGVVSDGTRHHVYRVLHRALQVAVRWKLITRNVCDAVEPPKVDEPDMYVL